jgi:hypothetical protein
MNEELRKHIEVFPSNFDTTDIAQQLRTADVPVQLYADVRDKLWGRLIKIKEIKSPVEEQILDAKRAIDEAVTLIMGTW